MLDYLISLLVDSNDFSWSSAKASHAVLQCCMEQGEIKDFTETDKIDSVRRAHVQRHTFGDQDASKKPAKHTHSKAMACQYYNLGTCSQQNHVCAFCLAKTGKNFPHTESHCRNKQK